MAEDSDNPMNLEPIRMLQLFPVRKIKCLEFDIEKYKKLFEVLKCTFCQQIFTNPTYLKCSHRFCKDCIEKHIRINDKKTCPICRGELATKRDSKSDLKLISLISYAFGDSVSLQAQIDKINEEATKNFRFIKTKTGIQMEIKRERTESMDNKAKFIEGSVRKRLKKQNDDGQKSQQQYKINIFEREKDQIEVQKNQQQLTQVKKTASSIQISEKVQDLVEAVQKKQKSKPLVTTIKPQNLTPTYANTKYKSSKKKKAEIIQIHSEGSNQIDPLKGKVANQSTVIVQENAEKAVQIVQAKLTPQIMIENKEPSKIQKQITVQVPQEQRSQQNFFKTHPIKDSILQARQKLKEAYGQNYIRSLIKSSNKKLSLKVKLLPDSSCRLPGLEKPQLQVSINLKIKQIMIYLLRRYNFGVLVPQAQQYVRISVLDQDSKNVGIEDLECTLVQLCERYWKDYKGIGIFNVANSLPSGVHSDFQLKKNTSLLSSLFKQPPKSIPMQRPSKTIYFNIKLSEISKTMTTKK